METIDNQQRPDVLVVGSVNRDTTLFARSIPQPGETVLGSSTTVARGGKGTNQAIAAARLGRAVAIIARVGADGDGTACLRALAAEGVDLEAVGVDSEHATGQATIIVDDEGENAIVVIPGANDALTPQAVRDAAPLLIDAPVMLIQLEIPMPTVVEAVSLARGTVVLNPAPAQLISAALMAQVDILVPNRNELAKISGRPIAGDLPEIERQARSIEGPRAVVVTLGSDGAAVVDESGIVHVPPRRVDVVDTSGAGDAFCGALADAISRGETVESAARWAVIAGAIATTRRGAQGGLPTLAQMQGFLP